LIRVSDWRTSYVITAIAVFVVVISAAQFLKRDPFVIGQVPDGKTADTFKDDRLNTIGFTLKEVVVNRQFWLFLGIEFCFGFVLFSILVHIVPHTTHLILSPSIASTVLAALGFFGIFGRITLGSAADRFGNKRIYIFGLMLMGFSLLWLTFAQEKWQLYLFSAIFGFAMAGIETSESPMTAWLFGLRAHGMVFGTITLGFTFGASLGPLITGYIFDITGGYYLAFPILAAISFTAALLTVFLKSLITHKSDN
jgi:MFS family permease